MCSVIVFELAVFVLLVVGASRNPVEHMIVTKSSNHGGSAAVVVRYMDSTKLSHGGRE